jgi:DNA-directed RNA polymerase subunit beta'
MSDILRDILGGETQQTPGSDFSSVTITVASPDSIRSWSKGEVKNPETINYRTFKPEKGGLFCERIFGPTRDWECSCGKYKRIKHKGVICDRCGVEVTLSRVRRERMGHIELAVPVTHIWFYKCMPSRIGLMLDMSSRQLERVIYYEDYLVIDPGTTPLTKGQLLTETEYREAMEQFGEDSFRAGVGGEAVRDLLVQTDLAKLQKELEDQVQAEPQEDRQATQARAGIHAFRHPSGMDGARRAARHPAGPASAGAARRRTLRDERPERSLSPRHQPEQPAQEPSPAQDA